MKAYPALCGALWTKTTRIVTIRDILLMCMYRNKYVEFDSFFKNRIVPPLVLCSTFCVKKLIKDIRKMQVSLGMSNSFHLLI